MANRYSTVRLSKELRDYLAENGFKGETFDAILRRLLLKAGHAVPEPERTF